ncbi:MAG: hypothetical protein IKS36_07375 [Bacteroidales bacterium]|nr:hypothetical protein [Bacteroidales bacterium]
MAKKTNNKRKKARKQPKPEFTSKTRLFDLVKKEHHAELRQLVDELRDISIGGDDYDWKTLSRLEADHTVVRNSEYILVIARFLHRLGKGRGLKCRMSTFIRWLSSTKHSNFGLSDRYVNKLIYNMLAYISEHENNDKN